MFQTGMLPSAPLSHKNHKSLNKKKMLFTDIPDFRAV